MSLPADIAAALASGDKQAAKRLAGIIAGQMARGECFGFDAELAQLRKLAGTDQPLGKLTKAVNAQKPAADGQEPFLPADLRDRAQVAVMAFENAHDDVAKVAAERELRLVHDEMATRGALAKALSEPKLMGALLQ